jgi:PilZ domain
MANTGAKRSREERVTAALPVSLDRGAGITRDVSTSGVFFETDVNYTPGSEISFSIELNGPAGKLMLKCQGQIVRVEDRGGKVGVAAKIIESRLETVNGGS